MLDATELKQRIIASGGCRPEAIVGCTEGEIEEIEFHLGLHLPDTYCQFLLMAGRGAGVFGDDLTMFYPDVCGLTESTREKFREYFELPEKSFVFLDRMGESFAYFIADGTVDPPIYGWNESMETPEKVYDSIWRIFEEELERVERHATRRVE